MLHKTSARFFGEVRLRQADRRCGLDGFVGAVVGGFELAVWAVFGVGSVVEAAVGEGTAEPFVKEEEEQGDLYALCAVRR